MIYEMENLVKGLGGIEKTKEALAYFRKLTKKAGFPNLHLQATIWSEDAVNVSGIDSNRRGSTKDMVSLLGFDSVTHYQFVHFADCNRSYYEILQDVKNEWTEISYLEPYDIYGYGYLEAVRDVFNNP